MESECVICKWVGGEVDMLDSSPESLLYSIVYTYSHIPDLLTSKPPEHLQEGSKCPCLVLYRIRSYIELLIHMVFLLATCACSHTDN